MVGKGIGLKLFGTSVPRLVAGMVMHLVVGTLKASPSLSLSLWRSAGAWLVCSHVSLQKGCGRLDHTQIRACEMTLGFQGSPNDIDPKSREATAFCFVVSTLKVTMPP